MVVFKVGDIAWSPSYEMRPHTEPCPICFGKRFVTLILGDGSQTEIMCDYCGKGCEAPTGTVVEYSRIPRADAVHIDKVSVETTLTGQEYTYNDDHYRYKVLYATAAEALAIALEQKKEIDEEEMTRARCTQKGKMKSYSWSAGYYRRKIKDAERDIAWANMKLNICKEKSKDKDLTPTP